MTLAEIIRAQLATGRPLRVTRALLEALDVSETDSGDLAAYDRARAAERELADLDLVLPAACGSRVDAARELARERDEAYAEIRRLCDRAAEREEGHDIAICERDEARVEVEQLRAERDEASESLRLSVAAWDAAGMRGRDAASVIREAEERGARWALATFFGPESSALVDRSREAARICEAARKAGEHE